MRWGCHAKTRSLDDAMHGELTPDDFRQRIAFAPSREFLAAVQDLPLDRRRLIEIAGTGPDIAWGDEPIRAPDEMGFAKPQAILRDRDP
jgi:hypothetical protein